MTKQKKTTKSSQTQEQRREQTQAAVLNSAIKLFGTQGYEGTSLEDIANDCNLTTRPVYHYFSNKKGLFEAAAHSLEEQLATDIDQVINETSLESLAKAWAMFLEICKKPAFRQIVLVDAPVVLGRERWQESTVVQMTQQLLQKKLNMTSKAQQDIVIRMILVALAEAALTIGDAENPQEYIDAANQLAEAIFMQIN